MGMPIIESHLLQPGQQQFGQQIYNGLDVCLTFEIRQEMGTLFNHTPIIYEFEKALQAPALEMMLRGFLIDERERQEGIRLLEAQTTRLDNLLQAMAWAVWGKGVNPNSPKQLIDFFYGAMKLPEQWISAKGVKRLSTNREALEKLDVYLYARPLIACILALRDCSKQLSVLRTEIDSDQRMRTSYNIAGTETGRWSSSQSSERTGTNLQNLSPRLRKMFVADPGWKLCGIDLEQAESREVGWQHGILYEDWTYLDACYSGDLHTITARLVWPNLPWTGNGKQDRAIADRIFYREFTYRDMSKRGGHGTSYYGTPFTMARHLKVPVRVMENFQKSFFEAYPGFRKWHQGIALELQTTHRLVTPFGRERHFFGRSNDDATLREAIAYVPQSSTADRLNLILWRIWYHMGTRVRIMAQVHDALYFQYRESDDEAEVIAKALGYFSIPMEHTSPGGKKHSLVVPGEAKIGWNWGNQVTQGDVDKAVARGLTPPRLNPDGLIKWKGSDSRVRTEQPTGLLARIF